MLYCSPCSLPISQFHALHQSASPRSLSAHLLLLQAPPYLGAPVCDRLSVCPPPAAAGACCVVR